MIRYLFRKVLQALITIIIVIVVTFFAVRITGDPVSKFVPADATPEDRQAYIARYGLDEPVGVQFLVYTGNLLKMDLGYSMSNKRPVTDVIGNRLMNTVRLALFTMITAVFFAVLLGTLSAVYQNRLIDRILLMAYAFGQAVPIFFLLLLAVIFFGVKLRWLPIMGMKDGLKSYIMPGGILGLILGLNMAQLLRNSMIEVLRSDYITLARLKGIPELTVIFKHSLKNAIIPMIALASMMFAYQLTGTMIVETIFSWPGLGNLAYFAVLNSDYPLVQALVLLMSFMIIFVNISTDLLYAVLDPRIRNNI
jgi:ABC-type dipeptide/oligopeptide/nickel transport system permease component